MMEALEHDDMSIRFATVFNMMGHCPQHETSFPVLQAALSHTDVRVRDLAVQALCRLGTKITDRIADIYEGNVKRDPPDLASRIVMLGYYFLEAHLSKSDRGARDEHVLWIISHAPESKIAGMPEANLDATDDAETYGLAKGLWLQQAESHCGNPSVIGNAASFFTLSDPRLSEALLKKARSLEPDNPNWSRRLGKLYSLRIRGLSSEERAREAAKSLVEYENAFQMTSDEGKKVSLLPNLAKTAFEAGEWDKARTCASELLSKVSLPEFAWSTGDALHHGNLVLGRLALKSKDIELAKTHLIAAGRTPGSPTLISFGPNMALAKELLELGEREVVIQYLELCSQ
ncbi:MAG: hypothetical protein L0312_26210, partial [Acidobacteria bacterium]|nr:hypothetical protein [Acidobacteriota bacterium]